MKKIILSSSFFVFISSIFINPYLLGFCIENKKFCLFDNYAHSIGKPIFYLSFFWVLFSLITYKMKDIIVNRWIKFVYVWIPLSIISVVLAPEYDSSLFPIEKGSVALFMSSIFVFVSISIIAISYLKKISK